MVPEDVAFWRWLGHEIGALMNGISTQKKTLENSFFSSSTWEDSKKTIICNLQEGFY